MPYLAHFGLARHPFGLTPNTDQFFPVENMAQVLDSLRYAIKRNSGIFKVVGDVGTGKTMLCRLLLRGLDGEGEPVAYLNAPTPDADTLLAAICQEFRLPVGSRAEMMARLNAFLLEQHAAQRNPVLVVDEAQALGGEGLETVRLLSNLETEEHKLLQIVLFGQPELDVLLARPDLRQITQRIVFAFQTEPFSRQDSLRYLDHRIACSRLAGVDYPIFTPSAARLLAAASRGVPRVINVLADKALLIAYGDGANPVTDRHVEQAIDDTPYNAHRMLLKRRKVRRLALALVAAHVWAAAGLAFAFPEATASAVTAVEGWIGRAQAHFVALPSPQVSPEMERP
ncbi:ExeA family protein [Telmatospirillum sp. J64-1]|uniref:ExeA family protein n=1 Tax=Telmatospirillum sp. J64-1 TaxID=2502183 RepID=UPI00115D7069|nr:AAA family ATPase [Telmatospirillum sp. J64-1]